MASESDVGAQVRRRIEAPSVPERLATAIGAEMRAKAVFGKPVASGDVKVIPVARARWAFGGGGGGDGEQQGSGGGGTAHMRPVGYIEVSTNGAAFKPIRDPRLIGTVVGVAVGAAALAVSHVLPRR